MTTMRLPLGPLLVITVVAAVAFATLHDIALLAGRVLAPWFGWMLP